MFVCTSLLHALHSAFYNIEKNYGEDMTNKGRRVTVSCTKGSEFSNEDTCITSNTNAGKFCDLLDLSCLQSQSPIGYYSKIACYLCKQIHVSRVTFISIFFCLKNQNNHIYNWLFYVFCPYLRRQKLET